MAHSPLPTVPAPPSWEDAKMISRTLQVKLVKPKTADAEEGTREPLDIDKLNTVVADQVFNAGVVVVGSICAVKVVSTVCTIAVNLTNPANWR